MLGFGSPATPEDVRALTREQLQERANQELYGSYKFTVGGVLCATILSRFVARAHKYTPLVLCATASVFLDFAEGRRRAQPYHDRLAELDAEDLKRIRAMTPAAESPNKLQ